jgi:hypothetical protein
MELIQCVEYASQGSLVDQLTLQGCDRGTILHVILADCHTFQTIKPGWVDPALDNNLVDSRAIEGNRISGMYIHVELIIDDFPAKKHHRKVGLRWLTIGI